jgi:CubicO group peptidase (beta-lactamase class C family)
MVGVRLLGDCLPRFEAVAQAFEEGFSAGREVGAAVAVWHDGDWVVDLWSGYADRRKSKLWQEETLACFFSVSKAITATCLLQAVDKGLLDLRAPVARYWPEFGQEGKEATTVAQILAHQAGLPGLHEPVAGDLLFDWAAMCSALAAETPWWVPGTRHGYHARTFGFLAGELLRRASGKRVGEWLADEICGPLDLDVHIGLTPAEQERCADMIPARVKPGEQKQWPSAMQRMLQDFTDTSTPTGAAFQNPSLRPGYMNSAEFRTAELPALNGHGTARDVARLLGSVPQLLSPALLQEATRTHSHGPDEVLKSVTRFGLGYMLYEDESPIGWPGCFGHAGAGGSIAFCDADSKLGFAFIMNQMQEGVVTGGTSATACVEALRGCL